MKTSLRFMLPVACGVMAAAPNCVAATPHPGWPADERIAAVLSGLRPPIQVEGETEIRWTLEARMRHYGVPGVSIAVVDDGQLVWAEGFGVKVAGGSEPVDSATLFQAASISKPVATLAILKLAERGVVDLDADVNTLLKSWHVPTADGGVQSGVTLRQILRHAAGFNVHGFSGFAASEKVPSLREILDGVPPAKNPPVRVEETPGTFKYSGGGFTVAELLIADVTKAAPPEVLSREVLTPFGMTSSTFVQPLPSHDAPRAATGHLSRRATPIEGGWHAYPMTFAAGLWTTPTDLSRVLIAVQRASLNHSDGPVSPEVAKSMLTRTGGPVGLGFLVSGEGPEVRFSHNGSNAGFRAMIEATAVSGKGLAIMANSDAAIPLIVEIARAIKHAYGWTDTDQRRVRSVPLDAAAQEQLVGQYSIPESKNGRIVVSRADSVLRLRSEGTPEPVDVLLVPTSADTFVVPELGIEIRAILNGGQPASALLINGRRRDRISESK